MSNLERMIQLADEFFAAKNDPDQISVTPEVMERLRQLHPATMGERGDGDEPVAWVLVIPTTNELMKRFIEKEINEKELLDATPIGGKYNAIYLCSALVLPEFRGKGIAKHLLCSAIAAIRKDHPIASLFYWAFSVEGEKLAAAASQESGIPLYKRV
jgi:GNAT superfamily N-acetyltransferase